ncbi:MAG: M14 family metallopeptidase [Candidatus Cyclobacteriaceae bacterium M2_1C_046]
MKKIVTLLLIVQSFLALAQTKAPAEFLGYEVGERFTRHHFVVDYYKHVAEENDNVQLIKYGETYEFRPLMVAIVSSPENMARLEEIRTSNLQRAGLMEGEPSVNDIAIVWLSYNIHGNESSSIEASMMTIYDLIDPENQKTKEWLKNTVVVIDPCINPDGRDRYANFYNQFGGRSYNPNGDAIEHHEPWPGGRPNHYLFDLNRDWAWQTQIESAQRSELYHKWMPHIHVDFHEQGYNSPYYFAPAAEPFHEVITPWQREFQIEIGRNNARYFDEEGWLYFTKERFDLLYPSYGDTYPTYNGAIGMTYEQAGGGYAGLGIITEYGDTLTLRDRALHHHTTGLSTVEVTSRNASNVVKEFDQYFADNMNNPAVYYNSYIISRDNEPDKIERLTRFLDKQKITYGLAPVGGKAFTAYDYQTQSNTKINLKQGDIVISSYQPMARLIKVFFEPKTMVTDTLTYDITAWSLPYAYGVKTFATTERIAPAGKYKAEEPQAVNMERPYAYVMKYNSFDDAKYLAYLLKNRVNVRVAQKPLTIDGKTYNRGSLVITRRTNEFLGDRFTKIVRDGAREMERTVVPVKSGFVEAGPDLGSGEISRVAAPNVAVLAGEQVSSLAFGEIWHYFERQLEYPVTVIGTDYFNRVNLSEYDVFIVPHGYYQLFDESALGKIRDWVRAGGRLILQGNALRSFAEKEGFGLKSFASEEEKIAFEKSREEVLENEALNPYSDLERDDLSNSIFGAIYKIQLDNTHPLAYGYENEYYTLKTNELKYSYLDAGNVGTLRGEAKPISGFAGFYATQKLKDSLVFGVEPMGSGEVVYMVDNPLFRGFWDNGKLLFSNAVFMVGR